MMCDVTIVVVQKPAVFLILSNFFDQSSLLNVKTSLYKPQLTRVVRSV